MKPASSSVIEPSAKWAPPAVEVGQSVLWSGAQDERCAPAYVQKVGSGGSLSLSVHIDGVRDHVFKSGVRHRDDPWLRTAVDHDAGTWRLSPRDIRIDALLATFASDEGR